MKSKQINVIILIFIQFGTIKTIKISDIERFQIDVPENVTTNCRQQMEEFVENLQFNSESWALKMLDATSKIPTGIFSLNFGELGSFDECINIHFEIDRNLREILLRNLIGFDSFQITFNDLLCQTRDDVYPKLTTGAILTISLLIFLLLLVLISTIYDVYCRQIGRPPAHEILIAFSLYTNGRKVFRAREPNPDELPCLDGLKFFSMMWVVSGHTFSIPASNGAIVNINGVLEWINSWRSMFIVSGTLSVDTFLVIAGCLMLYGFMKAQAKQIKFNVFLYYLHRYLRLTPCLAVVVLFSATMMNYFGSGPRWPLLNLWFKGNCEKYWWSTLLYVQNYVNVDQMCVGQTWYLDIDMQLYILSPILFYILWKWPKFGLFVTILCILITLGLSFYAAWSYQLPAILSNINGNQLEYQNHYYLLTHTRAAPWFIGVILGYILFKIKTNQHHYKLKTVIILFFWLFCFVIFLLCVFGGFSTLRNQNYDKWGNSLHITFVRPVWCLCISWIIFCCVNNYGGPINSFLSLSIYQILNRFTYSIYLTHVSLLFMVVYSSKTSIYFSDFNMAYSFWAVLWSSTLVSIILVFTVESPMIVIEKILFSKKLRIQRTECSEEGGIDNHGFNK